MPSLRATAAALVITALLGAVTATAQWDPANGQWGKEVATDVRIMTWNTNTRVYSGANKSDSNDPPNYLGYNPWHAATRVVAALKPDILLLQEVSDQDGLFDVELTYDLFFAGGFDPYTATDVGAYVQKYAPGFDMPYFYISRDGDRFNRNAIFSRFPLTDLNGDGVSAFSNIPTVSSSSFALGGDGGLRGFMFAEFDLPDDVYAGDIVVGNAHLKAFSGSSEHDQRVRAASNTAYYIEGIFNGEGGVVPDPNNWVNDLPPVPNVLDANTPVVVGGDWNEDVLSPGYTGRSPTHWLTQGGVAGGTDGIDRDGTDMTHDNATHPADGSRITIGSSGGGKLDYVAWQDSIATKRRSFIFHTYPIFIQGWAWPPELVGFTFGEDGVSSLASDHRPVIVDLILPLAVPGVCGDSNCDGVVDTFDIDPFLWALQGEAAWETYLIAQDITPCDFLTANDTDGDGQVDTFDIDRFVQSQSSGACPE